MNERQLQKLGFNKQEVSAESSGENPFYYYTYDIAETIHLITLANDEIENGNWYVEFFDSTPPIRFRNSRDLHIIINILEKSIVEPDSELKRLSKLTFLQRIKQWWRKYICAPVPPGLEDMFDKYKLKQK